MDPPSSSYQHNLSLFESASKAGEDFWLPRQESKEETEEEIEKKYAAYLRTDAYGAMGRGEISLKERILLGLALFTIVPLKVVLLFATVIPYYLLCLLSIAINLHQGMVSLLSTGGVVTIMVSLVIEMVVQCPITYLLRKKIRKTFYKIILMMLMQMKSM